jgi:hypothetical protein
MLTEEEEVNFCSLVSKRVEEQYGFADGDDLCFTLVEMSVIPKDAGIDEAARIVAMHIAQP